MHNSKIALTASMLVMTLFGSVHSFSVFLSPLESLLGASRAEVSLFYSLALVFLTIMVLVGHRCYEWLSPEKMILAYCFLGALGIGIASFSNSWIGIFLGYSLVFGCINGLCYGYTLQLMGRVFSQRRGFAMGAVTAAYGFGSIVFSFIFADLLETESVSTVFRILAICLIGFGILGALLLRISGVHYKECEPDSASPDLPKMNNINGSSFETAQSDLQPGVRVYWLCYFFGILSGLMIIGHAAAIVQSRGASESVAFWGAVAVGIGSTAGGFMSGYLIDRWPESWLLKGLPLLCMIVLLLLMVTSDAGGAIGLLCIIGFSYGSIITVYPVSISKRYGQVAGPIVYGKVFTAWGLAGLLGPWFAGYVFDQFASYNIAIFFAAITALLCVVAVQYSGISNQHH